MKHIGLRFFLFCMIAYPVYAALFEREGATYIISRENIKEMHAINLYDILSNIPSIVVERKGFASSIANITQISSGTCFTDNQIALEIDGVSIPMLNADRVYLNNIPINDIQRIEIGTGGNSLFGGQTVVKITTSDSCISDPQSHFYYETGPFDLNVLHFNFQRRTGEQTGMYLSMEKEYMLENLGMVHNGGTPYQYDQPGQIVDIYRAFLRRPDSLYVSDGYGFEDFNRNWTIKLNTIAVPGVSIGLGYQYARDFQDDYRTNPLQNEELLNFGSWHASDKFHLSFGGPRIGNLLFSGYGFSEMARITFLKDTSGGANGMDTSSGRQGINAYGGWLRMDLGGALFRGSMVFESRLNAFNNCDSAPSFVHNDAIAVNALMFPRLGFAHGAITITNITRRDSRYISGNIINSKALFSPSITFQCGLPLGISFDAHYGCDRKYPSFNTTYFSNPIINIEPSRAAVTYAKSYNTACGINFRSHRFDVAYRISNTFIKSPLALCNSSNEESEPVWYFSPNLFSYISRTENLVSIGYAGKYVSDNVSFNHVFEDRRYIGGGLHSSRSFYFRNMFKASKIFSEGKMLGHFGLRTTGRPDMYSIDFYGENNNNLTTLNRFLSFDIELGFRIKTFSFFSRLENLSNQVISYQPGYYLPGPLIRWGFDWSFGK